MKKLMILLTLGLFIACSATRGSQDTANSRKTASPYRIKKIVDEESFFIIYAARNDSTFKIVSSIKDPTDFDGEKIRVGKSYHLELKKFFSSDIDLMISAFGMPPDRKPVFIEKKSHYALYNAKNLNGLYRKKD